MQNAVRMVLSILAMIFKGVPPRDALRETASRLGLPASATAGTADHVSTAEPDRRAKGLAAFDPCGPGTGSSTSFDRRLVQPPSTGR